MKKCELETVKAKVIVDALASKRAYLRRLHRYLFFKAEVERRKQTLAALSARGQPTDRLEKMIERVEASLVVLRRDLHSPR